MLNEQEQTTYRQIVGQLNWAVQGSRPEMSFDMIQLSTKLKQGKVEDLLRAIKKVNRMKDINSFLTFPKLNKSSEIKVVVFTDASMASSMTKQGASVFGLLKVLQSGQMLHELYKYF